MGGIAVGAILVIVAVDAGAISIVDEDAINVNEAGVNSVVDEDAIGVKEAGTISVVDEDAISVKEMGAISIVDEDTPPELIAGARVEGRKTPHLLR